MDTLFKILKRYKILQKEETNNFIEFYVLYVNNSVYIYNLNNVVTSCNSFIENGCRFKKDIKEYCINNSLTKFKMTLIKSGNDVYFKEVLK